MENTITKNTQSEAKPQELTADYEVVETAKPQINAKMLRGIIQAKKQSDTEMFVESELDPILERVKEKALEGRNYVLEEYEPNARFRAALTRALYELGFSVEELNTSVMEHKAEPKIKISW